MRCGFKIRDPPCRHEAGLALRCHGDGDRAPDLLARDDGITLPVAIAGAVVRTEKSLINADSVGDHLPFRFWLSLLLPISLGIQERDVLLPPYASKPVVDGGFGYGEGLAFLFHPAGYLIRIPVFSEAGDDIRAEQAILLDLHALVFGVHAPEAGFGVRPMGIVSPLGRIPLQFIADTSRTPVEHPCDPPNAISFLPQERDLQPLGFTDLSTCLHYSKLWVRVNR